MLLVVPGTSLAEGWDMAFQENNKGKEAVISPDGSFFGLVLGRDC